MNHNFELLAPAGNMDCLYAAFQAGADAVYLAGQSFGARAYANNFTEEELVDALSYAHLHHKKIYLTLNTLIKEKEFSQIFSYLKPYYEAGLHGIIIQDLGLIPFLKEYFPKLELHASTQMTVNSFRSATFLKEHGISRVVPSRELSLDELMEIKEKAGIEVECFIHGALCYCYSGQCYFSSFLGGRSGNRGRCAGPCRLPYSLDEKNKQKKEQYPLSLKDLCSLPYLYDLMDGKIDSFKIEGRMKSPEYVAGVTAIYRKYMDYYIRFKGNRKEMPVVSKEDMDDLQKLYIRSTVLDGYFKRHNGRDMISIDSPSYKGCDENYVKEIHERFCCGKMQLPIQGIVTLRKNELAEIELQYRNYQISLKGQLVEVSKNRPLQEEDIRKQLNKTGNTDFYFEKLNIFMDQDIFLPLKSVNELRRNAIQKLKNQILSSYQRMMKTERISQYNEKEKMNSEDQFEAFRLHIHLRNLEQYNGLKKALQEWKCCKQEIGVKRIYLPSDLLLKEEYLIQEYDFLKEKYDIELFFTLPRIFRSKEAMYEKQIEIFFNDIKGFLVRNLEELQWLENCNYNGKIVFDYSLYQWNRSALKFCESFYDEYTYPLELNLKEIDDLKNIEGCFVVYGRVPMMVTANCVKKTLQNCCKNEDGFYLTLKDRYQKKLPVYGNCKHCYNEIYNAIPTSVHKDFMRLWKAGFKEFRLDFTDESNVVIKDLILYFSSFQGNAGEQMEFPLKEYTTGHFKEGAL